ncbi:MAG: SHOCT domain-containing protein [Nitrospirae bacterium]|nr:SHOCT domain-containing protein [Nitrospirota bacterium]
MRKPLFFIVVFLLCAIATGCVTNRTLSRSIMEDNYNSVSLETWLDASKQPIQLYFDQLVEIDDAEMKRILESIQVVEPPSFLSVLILKSKPEPEQAFIPAEAGFLAKPLATALREARPDERVVFFLHHQRTVYKGTTSSGVAFVKDKHLNILLGRYRMGNQPGYPDIPTGGNPFTVTNDQDFYITPGPFQSLVEGSKAPGGQENVFPQRWLSIDYASLLNPPPQTAAPQPAAPTTEPGKVEPAPVTPPPSTLEEKLKTLNKLKEEGLITEEEYNEKKKELLKSF